MPEEKETEEAGLQGRSVVEQWRYLFAKSSECFAALRHLPTYGLAQPATITRHYFLRSFQVSAKLWKFQQDYRVELTSSPEVALQRWDIGDIASKIGQLYYHYYLRTSDTACLLESFTFYDAIRTRRYFKDIHKAPQPKLWMLRKLRYYARFLVVCLLLEQRAIAEQLVTELAILVKDYIDQFTPNDAEEWRLVLKEISAFLQADQSFYVLGRPLSIVPASGRLPRRLLKASPQMAYKLHEAIIVGNSYEGQVKFSELTLNMCRMLQSLEIEVSSSATHPYSQQPSVSEPKGDETKAENGQQPLNPHKHLLYQPSVSTLLAVIASSAQSLPPRGVLFLYLSAEGFTGQQGSGLLMEGLASNVSAKQPDEPLSLPSKDTPKKEQKEATQDSTAMESESSKLERCLLPSDLSPFLRRPMLLVVESNQSRAFELADSYCKSFSAPVLSILSPNEQRQAADRDGWRERSLMTYFLHSPLRAFCAATGVRKVSQQVLDSSSSHVQSTLDKYLEKLTQDAAIPEPFRAFLADKFLQAFLLRFLFFHSFAFLWQGAPDISADLSGLSISDDKPNPKPQEAQSPVSLAKAQEEAAKFLPACRPSIPPDFLFSQQLLQPIVQLASILGVESQFASQLVPK